MSDEILTDTHLFFYSGRTIYSNWHETPRQFQDPLNNGLTFNSSEVAFMWWKAVFFQDHAVATALEQAGMDSRNAKQLGRHIRGYNDKAWECVRLGYMQYVLLLKFSQNPEWAAQLKATGDRILIEASPTDRIWGVGFDVEAAAAMAKRQMLTCSATEIAWAGRNLLGQALMTVRGLLTENP